jgi:hypothetical protein
MAQSAVTVTPPNPTPPTNFGCVGATPPTDPAQPQADDGTAGTNTVFAAKVAAAGAGTSVDAEGKGTETVVTAPGSVATAPTQSFSDLGNYTNVPNQQHASSLTPGAATITGLVPASLASGAGTNALAVNGSKFTKQSVVYVNGVAQVTSFVSSVQLNVNAAPKKATAGTLPVTVVTGGVTTPATDWTFT